MTSQDTPNRCTGITSDGYRVLPGVPESVRRVRAFVRDMVDVPEVRDAAMLAANEIATNAIRHSRSGLPCGFFSVKAEVRAIDDVHTLRIEIRDAGPLDEPHAAVEARPDDERMRGLVLVDAVTDRWGRDHTATGLCVWLELDWAQAGTSSLRRHDGKPTMAAPTATLPKRDHDLPVVAPHMELPTDTDTTRIAPEKAPFRVADQPGGR